MKAIISAVALALLCAAPAMARDQAAKTDLPRPASDVMVHPNGAFLVKWGETPEEVAKKWEPTWQRLTPVPRSKYSLFKQVPVLSYIYADGDFSYDFNAYFGPETGGLSIVSVSSDTTAECDNLESRLITQMGEGEVSTAPFTDDKKVMSRKRTWTVEDLPGNRYAYVFLPKSSVGSDYCLGVIIDANAGIF